MQTEENKGEHYAIDALKTILDSIDLLRDRNDQLKKDLKKAQDEILQLKNVPQKLKTVHIAPVYKFNIN